MVVHAPASARVLMHAQSPTWGLETAPPRWPTPKSTGTHRWDHPPGALLSPGVVYLQHDRTLAGVSTQAHHLRKVLYGTYQNDVRTLTLPLLSFFQGSFTERRGTLSATPEITFSQKDTRRYANENKTHFPRHRGQNAKRYADEKYKISLQYWAECQLGKEDHLTCPHRSMTSTLLAQTVFL